MVRLRTCAPSLARIQAMSLHRYTENAFIMTSISFAGNNHGIQVGDNRGSITTEFHLHSKRPETPPNPLSTVPFARDPDFVSRDILLHRIYAKSSVPGSRIALVGLGGVGKSQLAIEYSYQVRSESPAIWVLWVHASNEARFEQSFRDIADQVKITGRQDPKANIFKLVENWLRDKNRGKWLLILDNVDDDQLLCSFPVASKGAPIKGLMDAANKPLLEYVPRHENGFVIITTRTREVALKMVNYNNLIEVEPMEESEALELLQRKLDQTVGSQEGKQLVNALELMPLAIIQAASYIRHRAPRYLVSQYLRDFQGSDHEAIKLLKKEPGHIYRDWEAKNSILLTWEISFNHIRHVRKSAADLLSFMSFFDRQGIPENDLPRFGDKRKLWLPRLHRNLQMAIRGSHNWHRMLHPEHMTMKIEFKHKQNSRISRSGDNGKTCTQVALDEELENDIQTLRDYSFISISQDPRFFDMHRLVQLATRKWLETSGMIEWWKEQYIQCLFDGFPQGDFENWATCQSLFPHVKSSLSQRPKYEDAILRWAGLLYKGAWYASQSGKFSDAREMALKSMEEREKILGPRNRDTLESRSMLARAHWLEGSWEEAEKLYAQVFKCRKGKLWKDHPSLLTSLANLASTYWNLGRWQEAENLFMQVMKTREIELGENHPLTLTSMSNLAVTYACQGRSEEAEKLEVRVMENRKAKLGENHPSTLTSISNLALTYGDRGRWGEAENLLVRVIQMSNTMLGKEHPLTLTSMANLGLIYGIQGQEREAEKLGLQVMEIRKRKLGKGHPSTLTSIANLASLNRNKCQWAETEHPWMSELS